MLRQAALLLIPFLLVSQNRLATSNNQAEPYNEQEAYAVYAAVLPLEWIWQHAKAKRLVIRAETQTYQMCLVPEKGSEELYNAAISDFVKQNEKTRLLQPHL